MKRRRWWRDHRDVDARGVCWACVVKHAKGALAIAVVPAVLGVLGVEYEHHHEAPRVVAVVAPAHVSPWQNWPCDIPLPQRRAEAPDLWDVCTPP